MSSDPTPSPITPPGRWLDAATGSPAARLAVGVLLGVILTAAVQWVWPRPGPT